MYGIFIYEGVEPIDLGATIGVLSMARRIAPDLKFASVAREKGEIVCASGMRVIADYGFADAPVFKDLIVTGGPGWQDAANDPATLDYLRGTDARLSSICTGAMIMEAAGLLADRTVTTKTSVFDGETAPIDLLSSPASAIKAAKSASVGLSNSTGI